MESKCQDETLRMQGVNLNLCILHMSEDTSPLGVACIWSNGNIYYHYLSHPANTQRWHNVVTTSLQRHDVAAML